jgi:hypothetical protein
MSYQQKIDVFSCAGFPWQTGPAFVALDRAIWLKAHGYDVCLHFPRYSADFQRSVLNLKDVYLSDTALLIGLEKEHESTMLPQLRFYDTIEWDTFVFPRKDVADLLRPDADLIILEDSVPLLSLGLFTQTILHI